MSGSSLVTVQQLESSEAFSTAVLQDVELCESPGLEFYSSERSSPALFFQVC